LRFIGLLFSFFAPCKEADADPPEELYNDDTDDDAPPPTVSFETPPKETPQKATKRRAASFTPPPTRSMFKSSDTSKAGTSATSKTSGASLDGLASQLSDMNLKDTSSSLFAAKWASIERDEAVTRPHPLGSLENPIIRSFNHSYGEAHFPFVAMYHDEIRVGDNVVSALEIYMASMPEPDAEEWELRMPPKNYDFGEYEHLRGCCVFAKGPALSFWHRFPRKKWEKQARKLDAKLHSAATDKDKACLNESLTKFSLLRESIDEDHEKRKDVHSLLVFPLLQGGKELNNSFFTDHDPIYVKKIIIDLELKRGKHVFRGADLLFRIACGPEKLAGRRPLTRNGRRSNRRASLRGDMLFEDSSDTSDSGSDSDSESTNEA